MSVAALQQAIAQFPQWDAERHTSHYFADDMYCRMLFRPAGTLIVGKRHKKPHFYIVCSGTLLITADDAPAREVTGPCVIVSKPGDKRAVLAVTDATCLTVHRTKAKSIERIERSLVEVDPNSCYGPGNVPGRLLEHK